MKELLHKIWTYDLTQKIESGVKIGGYFVSALFLITLLFDYGFALSDSESIYVEKIYGFVWLFFLLSFTYRVIFHRAEIVRKSLAMTLIVGTLLYLSSLIRLFAEPDTSGFFLNFWTIFTSRYLQLALLTLLSLTDLSRGVVNFINKKTNPAMLLTAGFALVIFLGTILLLMPRSTVGGISVIDALFVSTSAVCVTGLTPVDVATTFTPNGQIVIALLIQIGGLGVMTLTSFFAVFFMGSMGLYNQFALKDMVSSDTFSSLVATLLHILGFTFVIEAGGALLIWASIHTTMGMTLYEEIFFSLFHAVSAFCNAGFSTLSGNLGNPAVMNGHNELYLVISMLIILGGIGFPILINFKELFFYRLKSLRFRIAPTTQKPQKLKHITNINTKIVLVTTTVLLIGGTALIALLEWNGAFSGMYVSDKLTQAFFNAVSPRTAGFNSVDLTHFSLLTIIVYMILMWIGGAAQSTAGGIKVNTLAVAFANFIAAIRGHDRINLYHRELSSDSVRRASATIFGSIAVITIFVFALIAMEPQIAPLHLLFETISAIGTVGSSLNTTPLLDTDSKILVAVIMFVGRVGLITVLMSLISTKRNAHVRFPKDKVIIN